MSRAAQIGTLYLASGGASNCPGPGRALLWRAVKEEAAGEPCRNDMQGAGRWALQQQQREQQQEQEQGLVAGRGRGGTKTHNQQRQPTYLKIN